MKVTLLDRSLAWVLAVSMLVAPSASASAGPEGKKSRTKGPSSDPVETLGKTITPKQMNGKRAKVRSAARSDSKARRYVRAAKRLRKAGKELGDPVLLIESSDAWLAEAHTKRSIGPARQVLETSNIAIDILFFLQDARSGFPGTKWQVVEFDDVGDLIERAEKQIEFAEALISQIRGDLSEKTEEEQVAEQEAVEAREQDHAPKPYKGMVAAGGTLLGVGLAGLGVLGTGIALGVARQNEIDGLQIPGEDDIAHEITQEGQTANTLAYVGLSVGLVGLLAGIPLLVIGQKRKKAAAGGDQARLRVTPMLGGAGGSGVVIEGRF